MQNIEDKMTYGDFLSRLRKKLQGIVPDVEIELKAEIAYRIVELKREKNAIILGHNYMEPALYHSIPDYVGDSLYLSYIARQTNADMIVFCGVWFMGETAKVLNPNTTVLVPSREAGCSLAEGISKTDVLELKKRFPGIPIISYVNTYAEVKAESDYCCTSGNAVKIIRHVLNQGYPCVIFIPDEFLAKNTAGELDLEFRFAQEVAFDEVRRSPKPIVLGWKSRCEVHELFKPEDVDNLRRQYPDVKILAHPECSPEVVERVDYAGSTQGMIEYIQKHPEGKYALLTECAMGENIQAEFPQLEVVRACSLRCKHMNLITLEQTLMALEKEQFRVELDADIIEKAKIPIQRMLEIK